MSETAGQSGDPAAQPKRREVWFSRVVSVAGAAAFVLALERAGRFAADRAAEIPRARVLGAAFGAHTAVIAAAGLSIAVLALVGARVRGPRKSLVVAILAAAMAAAPGALLGKSLASGAWVAQQSFAPAIRWGAPVGVAAAAFVAAWLSLRFAQKRARALLWAALAVGASFADALVLPGLYAGAHLFLYVLAAVSALLGFLAWQGDRPLPARAEKPMVGVAALLLIAGVVLLATLGESSRTALLSASPALSNLVGAAGLRSGTGILLHEIEQLPLTPDRAVRERGAGKALAPPARSAILIVVDTLRGDALPPVRTKDQTFARAGDTPFLDAFLQSTYRFRHAYSQASQTKRSMPPMFRSLHPFEDVSNHGIALPSRMREAGLLPIAVVPDYFLVPAQARSQEVLHGFERVAIFDEAHQEDLVPQAIRLLEEVRAEPFFAWIHFYNMHAPHFAGPGKIERNRPAAERYRDALRWLDGQIATLMAALDRLGLSSTTLVVLAADHGEHLGEGGRYGHGDGIHEEEMHTPLAFRIPGTQGAVIDGLAGNIDIVPTIVELLGQPSPVQVRGKSLVPLMREPSKPSGRAYYAQSGNGVVHGIISERSKLVYAEAQGALTRYDRVKDPRDRRNLLGKNPSIDKALVSSLVRKNPALFAAEYERPDVRRALEKSLAGVDPKKPPEDLAFLLKLAAAAPSPATIASVTRIFEGSNDIETRATIAEHVFAHDAARWSSVLERAIASATPEDETALVSALASRGQPAFGFELAAGRLSALAADPEAPATRAWLRLTERWAKPRRLFAGPLARVLAAALALPPERAAASAEITILALSGVAAIDPKTLTITAEDARALEERTVPLAKHESALVARAACRALAQVGGPQARDALLAVLGDRTRDARVRQAALLAIATIEGPEALPIMIREAEDPRLTVDAIQVLKRLHDDRALPFLNTVARTHSTSWARKEAQHAIDAIEGREPPP